MNASDLFSELKKHYFVTGFIILSMLISSSVAFSHGGKHAAGEFTHLNALKKATELFDQLIEKDKLDPTWERGLKQVEISNRRKDGKEEVAVAFYRTEGEPKSVYVFFTSSGKYAGSNFTGD